MNLSDYPDEDSEDLTEKEIESAIVTTSARDLAARTVALVHLSCPCCGQIAFRVTSAIRRRKPDLFSRLSLTCAANNNTVYTFRVNWLEGT